MVTMMIKSSKSQMNYLVGGEVEYDEDAQCTTNSIPFALSLSFALLNGNKVIGNYSGALFRVISETFLAVKTFRQVVYIFHQSKLWTFGGR